MANKEKNYSMFYLVSAIVFWILTFLCMIMIFYLSGESGSESDIRSQELMVIISKYFDIPSNSIIYVRKTAHVMEYAFLALSSFLAVRSTNLISKKGSYAESRVKLIKSDNEMYIIISMWMSLLFAIFDEYHQLFIEGRSGSIIDVCIDLIGIVIMLLIIRLVFTIYLRRLGRSEIRYD